MTNTTQTFEEKVKSMKASEIVRAMIRGLRSPHTDAVRMYTYGKAQDGVCYGCAATNAVCEIAGVRFAPEFISTAEGRAKSVEMNSGFSACSRSPSTVSGKAICISTTNTRDSAASPRSRKRSSIVSTTCRACGTAAIS